MNNFLSQEELKKLGLKSYGEDVLIGRNVMIYAPEKLSIGNHVRIDDFTCISGNVTLKVISISHNSAVYMAEKQGL